LCVFQSAVSFGPPTVTKDGVTVAKEIELKDPLENMGAQMVKEVASKPMTWQEMELQLQPFSTSYCKRRIENVAAGANPMDLKRGIDKAVQAIVTDLAKQSKVWYRLRQNKTNRLYFS
jgi:chaperonin GroEL